MKSMKLNLLLLCATFVASTLFAQFPYGASDPTYGLQSRAETDPGFTYTPSPSDWRDINMYQIFTDRFADGDSANNTTSAGGIDRSGWSESGKSFPWNRNYHHGGDWKGLKDNLDYLDNMGVRAIWISGVQMNNQGKDSRWTPYHQYHPTDFFKCEPTSGTFQELKDLIDDCHSRGIYVVLDVVINHMADLNGLWGNSQNDDTYYHPGGNGTHGWWDSRRHGAPFTELGYFHNNGTIVNWDSSPENLWGQFKGTDDLRTEDANVQGWLDEAFKNLIDATDCDGFRVDAIKHVEYNWCKSWADSIRQHAAWRGKNDFILFGELFSYDNGALASYCNDPGYSFNSALFFPLSQNIKNVFVDGSNPDQLTSQLNNRGQYGEGADRLVAFIDNHDVNRISLINGGNTGDDVWKLRPALSFLYLATPVPCLYYGTEHAFDQGGHYNGSARSSDDSNPDDGDWQRETMFDRGFQPGPAAGNKLAATDAPLYQHIKALNEARAAHPSLTRGSFAERWAGDVYAFIRNYDDEEALVAINIRDGGQSISPSVGKPDGTLYFNALNPSDTVTSSGGTISVSLSGKETKIYVAGIPTPEMWVSGTHTFPADGEATATDPIFVNTEAGPTGLVTSVKLGYSADGGTSWNLVDMTATNWASTDGTWFNAAMGSHPAGTVIEYYIEVADGDDNKIWDNNGGANYMLTVLPAAGVWVQNSRNYPVDGDATDANDIYLNCEAGPSGSVDTVTASYSTDDGATWTEAAMALNAWESDGGNWYEVNLGSFPADTQISYFIEAVGLSTTNRDDNGGQNFQLTIRNSLVDSLWVGMTDQSPENGSVTSLDTVTLTAETWPIDAATNVGMAFSIDGGGSWMEAAFTHAGTNGNNDVWTLDVGPYPDGTLVSYATFAESLTLTAWDNNGGLNHRIEVGEVGGLRMVEHTPVINSAGAPDNPSDDFDFDMSGGAATTGGTAGFGDFGSIYVNFDDSNLYIGGTGVALPDDSQNNAYMVFLGGGTNVGLPNFWSPSGNPQGLDNTHNAAFQPNVNVAILLGDVWGDGTFTNFEMYVGGGFNFGQGVFELADGASGFAPLAGSAISQFGGYGPDSRLASNWECAVPLSAFGVTDALDLTNLYVSGLMVTGGTSNDNRFISGRYLGDSATLGNGEEADEFGNFAFSFVNLAGTRVLPPSANADMGVPDSWVMNRLGSGYTLTTNSNMDGDFWSDRYEYFAGLDPTNSDDLVIMGEYNGELKMHKVGGQAVTYVIHTADQLIGNRWNWTPRSQEVSFDGMIPMPTSSLNRLIMKVDVNVPAINQPVDRVNVSASPAGGSFSASNVTVVLSVSGVNVTSSTYTVEGGSAVDYANGDSIVFGDGMTVGESRTLTLNGSTINGTTDQEIYTFTRTAESLQVSWVGNAGIDPASGAWDAGEDLMISFETTPLNAAVAANLVYNDGGGWVNTPMVKGSPNTSNDTWSINLGSYAAGTTVQFVMEAKDSEDNSTWENNGGGDFFMTVNGGGGGPGGNEPYSTNPTKGKYRASGITIDGANTGSEWADDMLIALDMANDDPRSLGSNWTMHEAPIDFTHLWACWDDNNIYLAFQFVDVTDVIDGANAGGAGSGKISNNGGHLISIALNTQAGGSTNDMWGKSNFWGGSDVPDFQVYMRGDLWAGASYMSTALPGDTWAGDPELGTTYNTFAGWGMDAANGDAYVGGASMLGVGDADNRLDVGAPDRNFMNEGHDTSRDSFYEIKIPMASIGITKSQLESAGIGVMLTGGSESALDTIPNSAATSDSPGVEVWNSSFEWGDVDVMTEGFARIGN